MLTTGIPRTGRRRETTNGHVPFCSASAAPRVSAPPAPGWKRDLDNHVPKLPMDGQTLIVRAPTKDRRAAHIQAGGRSVYVVSGPDREQRTPLYQGFKEALRDRKLVAATLNRCDGRFAAPQPWTDSPPRPNGATTLLVPSCAVPHQPRLLLASLPRLVVEEKPCSRA